MDVVSSSLDLKRCLRAVALQCNGHLETLTPHSTVTLPHVRYYLDALDPENPLALPGLQIFTSKVSVVLPATLQVNITVAAFTINIYKRMILFHGIR